MALNKLTGGRGGSIKDKEKEVEKARNIDTSGMSGGLVGHHYSQSRSGNESDTSHTRSQSSSRQGYTQDEHQNEDEDEDSHSVDHAHKSSRSFSFNREPEHLHTSRPQIILPPATNSTTPPRPILGRSNTIATSGGEERRSVIGRRMMERLGNRVAREGGDLNASTSSSIGSEDVDLVVQMDESPARSIDNAPVRPRLGASPGLMRSNTSAGAIGIGGNTGNLGLGGLAALAKRARERREMEERMRVEEQGRREHEQEQEEVEHDIQDQSVRIQPQSPSPVPNQVNRFEREDSPSVDSHEGHHLQVSSHLAPYGQSDLDRTLSRMTARSGVSDFFEYEGHLRRSGSEKRYPTPTSASLGSTPLIGSNAGNEEFVGDNTIEEILQNDSPDIGADNSFDEVGSRSSVPGLLTPGNLAWKATPISPGMFADAEEEDGEVGQDDEYHEDIEYRQSEGREVDDERDLLPPLAPFASTAGNTPDRHSEASSGRKFGHYNTSPSASSIASNISGVPFIVEASPGMEGSLAPRPRHFPGMPPLDRRDMSLSSFPAEVAAEDGRSSGYGTPAKQPHRLIMTDSPASGAGNSGVAETDPKETPQRQVVGTPLTHRRLGSAFKEHLDATEDEDTENITSPAGRSEMS